MTDNIAPGLLKPTSDYLLSGMTLTPNVRRRDIIWFCDPWVLIAPDPFSFFTILVSHEVQAFLSASNNLTRETFLNRPGVGSIGTRPVLEQNTITSVDSINNARVQESTRERNRYGVAFTGLIFVASWVYASTPEWRDAFISRALRMGFVPQYTSEVFKKVRSGQAGNFNVRPSVFRGTWDLLKTTFPEYENTFIDPDFLCSTSGVQMFCTFLAEVRQSEGCYVPFVAATTTSLPHEVSQYTLTQTMCTTDGQQGTATDLTDVLVHIAPGHAYGRNTVEATHLGDNVSVNGVLVDPADREGTPAIAYSSTSVRVNQTTRGQTLYIVDRVLGIITNPGRQDKPEPKQGSEGQAFEEELPSQDNPFRTDSPPPNIPRLGRHQGGRGNVGRGGGRGRGRGRGGRGQSFYSSEPDSRLKVLAYLARAFNAQLADLGF